MLACPSSVHHPLARPSFSRHFYLCVYFLVGWPVASEERAARARERAGTEGGLVGGRAHDQDNDDDSCYAEVPPPLPPQSTVVEAAAAAATYF